MKTITSLTEIEKITDGDPRSIKELLEVFVTEAAKQIKDLKNRGEKNDWNGLKDTAHKVKSSLMLVGMGNYRILAEEIEKKAGLDPEKTKEFLTELITAYSKGLVELKNKLKQLS